MVEGAKADPLPTEFVNPGLLDVRCRELWFRKFEFVIFFGFVVVVLCGRVGALCCLHSATTTSKTKKPFSLSVRFTRNLIGL